MEKVALKEDFGAWWNAFDGQSMTLEEWLNAIPSSNAAKNCNARSLYKKEFAIGICIEWARTGNLTQACRKYNLYRGNFYRWRSFYPEVWWMFLITKQRIKHFQETVPGYHKQRLRRSRVPSIVQSDNKNPQLKYDPSYKNKVLSRKSLSAKAIGVHNNTVINWTRRYPEFRHAQLVAEVSSQLPALEEEVSLIEEKILKNETGSKN
jgi:hypothetical protein